MSRFAPTSRSLFSARTLSVLPALLLALGAPQIGWAGPDRDSPGKSLGSKDPQKKMMKQQGGTPDRNDGGSFALDFDIGISVEEARSIAQEYRVEAVKPLPPGIQKNLARGKPMPPGIARTRFPDGFDSELPQHAGYEWQQAGHDLVLVDQSSLIIAAVLQEIFN